MELFDSHERVLRALADGLVLKAHRTLDGEKTYRIHALDGIALEVVDNKTMGDLKIWKLIDSNKKFPAASYLLTDKGRRIAKKLVGKDIAALGAENYVED